MTTQEQIQAIEEAIKRELVDAHYILCKDCPKKHESTKVGYCECGKFLTTNDIVYKPITLHYVLMWIEIKSKHNVYMDTKGEMYKENYHGELECVCTWDFGMVDTLLDQMRFNPPLVDFLYSFLS
jgi:hypothetical protein